MNFQPIKIYLRNQVARIGGNYHESSDCFEYPKKSLLKSSYPKKCLPQFSTQENPEIENFKPHRILRLSLSLEIWSTPLGSQGHKEGKKLLQNVHNNKFTHTFPYNKSQNLILLVMASLENTHHYQRKYEVFTLTVKTLS